MAFITPLTIAGRDYPAAYVKVTIARCDTTQTILLLHVWESQEVREQKVPSLNWADDVRSPKTELELQAANPVDYGYKLLEASGEFPEATWNV